MACVVGVGVALKEAPQTQDQPVNSVESMTMLCFSVGINMMNTLFKTMHMTLISLKPRVILPMDEMLIMHVAMCLE